MGTGKRSSESALKRVLGKGGNVTEANPLEVHDPKVGSLVSYEGVTTANGAADGSTLLDNVLTTKADFNGNLVIITSGAYAGQARDINGVTTGGTVSPHLAFGGQILSGTTFVIAAIRLTPAEVAALTALVVAIKVATDKQAGETPGVGSVSLNWNTGTGTSGESGGDLCTIGANDTKNKLLLLVVTIDAATAGAVITVKMFMQVDGVERKVYSQQWLRGTDPDGLWIVSSTVAIHEQIRVEVESDVNEAVEFDYDFMLEAM